VAAQVILHLQERQQKTAVQGLAQEMQLLAARLELEQQGKEIMAAMALAIQAVAVAVPTLLVKLPQVVHTAVTEAMVQPHLSQVLQ
jgi:hypothetical protein